MDEIIKIALSYGIVSTLVCVGLYTLIHMFIIPYLETKAKNYATKEDIGEITNKVEEVKLGYSEVLETLKKKHSIEISAIEQEKQLKKEIYMQCVESLTRNISILPKFSNLELSNEVVAAVFDQEAAKIAKINVVGDEELVIGVLELMSELTTSTLDLLLDRTKILLLKGKHEKAQNILAEINERKSNIIQMMDKANLEGNNNKQYWELLNTKLEYENGKSEEFSEKFINLDTHLFQEHISYTEKCVKKYSEVAKKAPRVILAIREELDLPISKENFLKTYDRSVEDQYETFQKFLVSAKILIGDLDSNQNNI